MFLTFKQFEVENVLKMFLLFQFLKQRGIAVNDTEKK